MAARRAEETQVTCRKTGSFGRPMRSVKEIQKEVEKVPQHKRTPYRSLSNASSISVGTLYNAKENGVLVSHGRSIGPPRTQSNLIDRVRHCLSFLRTSSRNGRMYFINMTHHVHIDEKLFQLTTLRKRFLLSPSETAPHRHVK